MNRLHSLLAIVAALAAAEAGVVDRGSVDPGRRHERVHEAAFIPAPELAGRIMRGDPVLRVFDLRPRSAFEQFHVPGATRIAADDLAHVPLTRQMTVVLYGDAQATLVDAVHVLGRRNHHDVRVLREGLYEWLSRVHEPRLAVDATPSERAEFERAAAMSRFFGGVPRAGVPREEVPLGYWTGNARTEALLMAAAVQSIVAIRRRGC